MLSVAYNDVLFQAAELAGRTRDKLPVSEAVMMRGYIAEDLRSIWTAQEWPELVPDPVQVNVSDRQFSKFENNGAGASLNANLAFIDPNTFFTATTAAAHGLKTGMMVIISAAAHGCFNGQFVVTVTSPTQFTCPVTNQNSAFGENGIAVSVPTAMGDILGVTTANPLQTTRYRDVDWEEGDGKVRILESLGAVWVEYMLPRPNLMKVADADLANYPLPERFSNYLALRAGGLLLQADGLSAAGGVFLGLAGQNIQGEIARVNVPTRRRHARVRHDGQRPVN